MALATDLLEASDLSFAQIHLKWNFNALSLSTPYGLFIEDCKPIFSDTSVNDRIVRNWLVPMASLHAQMLLENPVVRLAQTIFSTSVEYVTRMTISAYTRGLQGFITGAQATALLAAWNARFGS